MKGLFLLVLGVTVASMGVHSQRVSTCAMVDCQPGKVCIETPKGPKCVLPNREGRCPAPRLPATGYPKCRQDCTYDVDCPGLQKCCPAGPLSCGRQCSHPEPTNRCTPNSCPAGQICIMRQVFCLIGTCPIIPTCVEKQCPAFPDFIPPDCVPVDTCSRDSQCPSGQLCCATNCGRHCVTLL